MTKSPALLAIISLTIVGMRSAGADIIQTIPFSINAPMIGVNHQTVSVPQFDPAQGILQSLTLTITENYQFVFEIFNNGPGTFSATVQDSFTFGGVPQPVRGDFSTIIPAGQPIYNFSPPLFPSGPLTETFDPKAIGVLTGTGTIPFDVSLAPPSVVQYSGSTTTSALAFAGVTGTVTADYAFAPAQTPVPEPRSAALFAAGLLSVGAIFRVCRVRLRKSRRDPA